MRNYELWHTKPIWHGWSLVSVIVLYIHISTFWKEKQKNCSKENVLLLTHCAPLLLLPFSFKFLPDLIFQALLVLSYYYIIAQSLNGKKNSAKLEQEKRRKKVEQKKWKNEKKDASRFHLKGGVSKLNGQ